MKMSQVINTYGDLELSPKIEELLGIKKRTCDIMLNAEDVNLILNTTTAYVIIAKLKAHYCLAYEGAKIPLKLLCDYYSLDVDGAYEVIKKATNHNSGQA